MRRLAITTEMKELFIALSEIGIDMEFKLSEEDLLALELLGLSTAVYRGWFSSPGIGYNSIELVIDVNGYKGMIDIKLDRSYFDEAGCVSSTQLKHLNACNSGVLSVVDAIEHLCAAYSVDIE